MTARRRRERALAAGAELAAELDADVVALGEMGIGNTTAASALTAALLGVAAGSGLRPRHRASTTTGVARKVDGRRRALAVERPASTRSPRSAASRSRSSPGSRSAAPSGASSSCSTASSPPPPRSPRRSVRPRVAAFLIASHRRPSPATRWCSRRSASSRCSTSACGSARARAPRSRCRCSTRRSRSSARWRPSTTPASPMRPLRRAASRRRRVPHARCRSGAGRARRRRRRARQCRSSRSSAPASARRSAASLMGSRLAAAARRGGARCRRRRRAHRRAAPRRARRHRRRTRRADARARARDHARPRDRRLRRGRARARPAREGRGARRARRRCATRCASPSARAAGRVCRVRSPRRCRTRARAGAAAACSAAAAARPRAASPPRSRRGLLRRLDGCAPGRGGRRRARPRAPARRWLGGVTGDTLGAATELAELRRARRRSRGHMTRLPSCATRSRRRPRTGAATGASTSGSPRAEQQPRGSRPGSPPPARGRVREPATARLDTAGRSPRLTASSRHGRRTPAGARLRQLEGRAYEEIEHAEPELFRRWMETPTAVRFPGGEGYADLRARALARSMRCCRRTRRAVVVTHGGVLRAALAAALELADEAIFRLDQAYGRHASSSGSARHRSSGWSTADFASVPA